MGLGKTLQVISFIAALVTSDREKKIAEGGRYLVVAPLSVLPNWMEQFEQFAPSISTVMYIGPAKDREATQKVIVASPLDQPLVVVTSYEMLLFDHEDYFSAKAQRLDENRQAKSKRVSKAEELMRRLLAPLLLLRTACNHPYLFPGAEPEPFVEGSHFQSPPFLDIIQDFLTLESFAYERIDGSVRGKERWQCIERFKKDPETFVFLISTRAGGLGLNLQNLQAIARAYRLGQTKPIHVIKFLCANTVEESIYRRTLKKMRMADRIRNLARRTDDEDDETDDDSNKSLLDTIQFGLHRLMQEAAGEDEDTLMKPLEEEYIQHILARKSLHPVEEIVCSDNVPVATLKSDKLLESDDEEEDEEDEEQAIENEAERARIREERRQKALERKLAQWKANKYTSAAIDISKPGDGSVPSSPRRSDDYDSSRNSGRLYYKSGDASHPPLSSLRSGPYIVFHCVDNSGVWCSRGFFRSLSALSPAIQKQYEAAARNGDLKLGSAHLIRLPTNGYVCLLVVQGFIGKKKQRVGNGPGTVQIVRQGKSSTLRLNALETALQALAHRALELGATVHLPRIGYGTPNFNWYAVERLLARNLRDW
ncbi:P-loop containing nucleoside triphosphate hydrolase [Phytophthora cactorum]|nr:P-loop containing nucleoside triphosphate hydrolase [Phytophthora cactorum]